MNLVLLVSHDRVEYIKRENILEKKRINNLKNEDENFHLFLKNSYSLQNLITKISILSNRENIGNFFFEKLSIKAFFSVAIKFRINELYKKVWEY